MPRNCEGTEQLGKVRNVMDNIIFEIRNAKKCFHTETVLNDVSLTVKKGEVVSIIGPSGSGKSTLLRCATLLEELDGGELSYMGQTVCREENGKCVYLPKKELKPFHSYFGLVFQNFFLFPHYSVLKNVMDAPLSVQKVPIKEAEENARALLKRFGLEGKEEAYPYQLSGGQKQRVSIARALALKPEVLFFDEPTSALDPELTAEVLKVIKQLADEKMTMIIVTHEMKFARDVSDRVLFLEGGHVLAEGTPDEVFRAESGRVKDFIGKLG